ncbi:MAG: pitrilysin family protein [Patescibacteria group bacterium]
MRYKKTTLPSGLRVIIIPTKGNPAVTVMALVETGSNYETKGQNGLSHFLEHMMFKGTKRRPSSMDISHELDGLGAESNAFTSNEMTGYWAKAEKKHLKKLLDIISDMYLNPTLPKVELEKERGVILQEISMYEDLPQVKVWNVFASLLYGDTPAGRAILGPASNIKNFKREDFDSYRKAHYVAKKTLIVVAGDINETEVVREVKNLFKTIPDHKTITKQKVVDKQKSPQISVYKKKTDQTHLILGVRTFGAKDKRRASLSVLAGVLGGGMSSRLFQRLREKMGVCYYVRANDNEFTDHGQLAISAGVDNKRVVEVISALIEECNNLKTEFVPDSELKKVKDYMVGNFFMGLETTDSLANFYADQEITKGKNLTPFEIEKEIRKVTAKDIQKVAKEIFINKNLNLAVVGEGRDNLKLKKVLKF